MNVQKSAYFSFTDASEKCFVIELVDEEKIAHVRRILSGDEIEYIHLSGKIIKEKATYNSFWGYHLASDSIEFFGYSIEVCDATMEYIEDNLAGVGGAFLPNNSWCPWSSEFVDEIEPDFSSS